MRGLPRSVIAISGGSSGENAPLTCRYRAPLDVCDRGGVIALPSGFGQHVTSIAGNRVVGARCACLLVLGASVAACGSEDSDPAVGAEFTAVIESIEEVSDRPGVVDMLLVAPRGDTISIRFPPTPPNNSTHTIHPARIYVEVPTEDVKCVDGGDALRQWEPGLRADVILDPDIEVTAEEYPDAAASSVVIHCDR